MKSGRFKTGKRKCLLTQQQNVKLGNLLSQDVVMDVKLEGFKRELDIFMEDRQLSGC